MIFVGREKETEIYKTYLNEFLQVYKDDASKEYSARNPMILNVYGVGGGKPVC